MMKKSCFRDRACIVLFLIIFELIGPYIPLENRKHCEHGERTYETSSICIIGGSDQLVRSGELSDRELRILPSGGGTG